ncbi:protein NYNRIN-like [Anoplophora glabripennis]|uniref:protein NYNRIN-like n=1 Tax=Anoplophora glabripennis TaxID=217634 RepID=UPI0008746A7A|nr:protein NYNRIN-like [Anoplophora glabripennis]
MNKGDIRQNQKNDPKLDKIIVALEGADQLNVSRWTESGYLMANGILYHWDSEHNSDEPQLVIPASLREDIRNAHDSAKGGHYVIDRTIQEIATNYYFVECQHYKATNLKPAGLLQTPAPAQRLEVISVDLFGQLPITPQGNRWILIVEDIASKWVELFPLEIASAETCAKILINEIILRFGTPRKMISDNGVQFISEIMQKVIFCFGIRNSFIPAYHPESNPVELITPYLRDLENTLRQSKETLIREQDKRKQYADQRRRAVNYKIGQKVLLKTHVLSNAQKGISSKLAPKRDGPYLITKLVTPTTYELSSISAPTEIVGRYHVSDLTEFREPEDGQPSKILPTPLVPKQKRGRTKKT